MALEKNKTISYFIYGLVLIGSLTYIWASWFGIPVWRYYPVLNEWRLGKTPGEISMGYYGKFFIVIPISIIGAIIIFLIARQTSLFSGSKTEELIFGGVSSASVFIAFLYYIGHEGTAYIVETADIDPVVHAIIWFIVLMLLLVAVLLITKKATKSVFGESKREVI